MNKEKGTADVQGQTAPDASNAVINSILPQNSPQSQATVVYAVNNADGGKAKRKNATTKKDRKKTSKLGLHSRAYSVAIKCYVEQLPYGLQATLDAIRKLDKDKVQIIAIVHDRDVKTDGIWLPAYKKLHLHIYARCKDRHGRIYVNWLMNVLGVHYRPGVDDELWNSRGVETCGDFANCAMYATHETQQAIQDGKELYSIDEIVTNLTREELLNVRDGYNRLAVSAHRVSPEDLVKLDDAAYELGYNLKAFEPWYDSQPFPVRACAKIKVIKESYERGVQKIIDEHVEIPRVCIFLGGDKNTGKTFNSNAALRDLGITPCRVGGGRTGKFDNVKADTGAIIIDDDTCPDLLNMSDNYICRAYRRNKNSQPWTGKYLIITSNKSFYDWVESCGIHCCYKNGEYTPTYMAIVSRFFICHMGHNADGESQLFCDSVSTRGGADVQTERLKLFMKFKKAFNDNAKNYKPYDNKIDYSVALDELGADVDTPYEILNWSNAEWDGHATAIINGHVYMNVTFDEYTKNKQENLQERLYKKTGKPWEMAERR